MSMQNTTENQSNSKKAGRLNDWVAVLTDQLPQHLQAAKEDLSEHLRVHLQHLFREYALVTREEFDIQKAVLLRTRQKLDLLQRKLEVTPEKNRSSSRED